VKVNFYEFEMQAGRRCAGVKISRDATTNKEKLGVGSPAFQGVPIELVEIKMSTRYNVPAVSQRDKETVLSATFTFAE
jgi:hypothetical protein